MFQRLMNCLKNYMKYTKKGFIPSITRDDPGVGDTLEHELGISRNNSK